MDDFTVALCILIIDRNRFYSVTLILNTGGVLRAMTNGKLQVNFTLWAVLSDYLNTKMDERIYNIRNPRML